MINLIKDLLHFHMACDVKEFGSLESVPPEVRELRFNLLIEEFEEYKKAENNDDETGIADALVDLIYIAIGTARVYGIPIDKVWEEVQKSNMAKVDMETGKVKKREDGKVLKPEGWIPPQIAKAIQDGRKKK